MLIVKWHKMSEGTGVFCRLDLILLVISKERSCLEGGEWPEEKHSEGKANKSEQRRRASISAIPGEKG